MSGKINGEEVDVRAVGDTDHDSGVPDGDALLAFTEAVLSGTNDEVTETREALRQALGDEGVVDAAAVIAMFTIMDRIADATGIPIDEGVAHDSRYQLGHQLGMDHLQPG